MAIVFTVGVVIGYPCRHTDPSLLHNVDSTRAANTLSGVVVFNKAIAAALRLVDEWIREIRPQSSKLLE